MDSNPWDGIKGLATEATQAVVGAVDKVKNFSPWEGIDTAPKEPTAPKGKASTMDMNVQPVNVSTDKLMRQALNDPVIPDTSHPRDNIAEIDKELKATKDPNVIHILQEQRRAYERQLKGMIRR